MTTTLDRGSTPPAMLNCPLQATSVYSALVLGLRDMRAAHRRDETTGEGAGGASWTGLAIGMVILDSLREPGTGGVRQKWAKLLTSYDIGATDADDIYQLRCSLLHGYYVPRLRGGRQLQLQADQDAFAVDTNTPGLVSVSVPVFCRCLVERIALEAKGDWDDTLIDTATLDLRR